MTAKAAWRTDDGFALACLCGGYIYVTVEVPDPLPADLHDFAVTCDRCGEVHWVTPVVNR